MLLASVLIACAMCADPDGGATAVPVVAVADVDTQRATAECATVGAIAGTLRCAILPPPAGLAPADGAPLVILYSDDVDGAEAVAIALNEAYQGRATISTRPLHEAPPAPYALSPADAASASAPII